MKNLCERFPKLFAPLLLVYLLMSACQNSPTGFSNPSSKSIQGITLATWSSTGYNSFTTARQIERISEVGASHLAVLVTAYQDNIHATSIRQDFRKTPEMASIQNCIDLAVSQGLKVTLKPHINVDDFSWSGNINPDDAQTWFSSYWDFILPLAELAQNNGASQFIVGTELAGTLKHKELWQETILKVRDIFSGELLYAASWDEATTVPFWQELDFVGINFYFPVANRSDPSRLEILKSWQPWLNHLEKLQKRTGKNLVLTEIGYRSIDGAGMKPHDFRQFSSTDVVEQADLYWAAFEATHNVSWINGMFWWNWLADGQGGYNNSDYTPAGKPAELEITNTWKPLDAQ